MALLEVEDTGQGMSPEVQAKVFEAFFTTKAPGKGTGLGLASVRALVAKAGGQIHLWSVVGQGTRFTLEPLARLLGIAHVVCTVFEERDGLLTGLHVRPACAGNGKVTMAERFASEHDVDLGASYFYTDSHADMGLLERVGIPRVITPDRRLRRQARLRGWRIEDWAIA